MTEYEALKTGLAAARVRIAELQTTIAELQTIKRTCECSLEDQCVFASERDEAMKDTGRMDYLYATLVHGSTTLDNTREAIDRMMAMGFTEALNAGDREDDE